MSTARAVISLVEKAKPTHPVVVLFNMVHDRMAATGEAMPEAIEFVQQDILTSGELEQWWESLGTYWIRVTEKDATRRYKSPRPVAHDADSLRPLIALPTDPIRPSVAWWQQEGVSPWDLEMPVGKSGERKRIGSFTRSDIESVRQVYHAQGLNMVSQSKRWSSILQAMGTDEVLQDAAPRLSELDRSYLADKLGVPVEKL